MDASTVDEDLALLRRAAETCVSQREAARLLGLKLETLKSRVWYGHIPVVRVGSAVCVPRSAIEALKELERDKAEFRRRAKPARAKKQKAGASS